MAVRYDQVNLVAPKGLKGLNRGLINPQMDYTTKHMEISNKILHQFRKCYRLRIESGLTMMHLITELLNNNKLTTVYSITVNVNMTDAQANVESVRQRLKILQGKGLIDIVDKKGHNVSLYAPTKKAIDKYNEIRFNLINCVAA